MFMYGTFNYKVKFMQFLILENNSSSVEVNTRCSHSPQCNELVGKLILGKIKLQSHITIEKNFLNLYFLSSLQYSLLDPLLKK